MSSKDRAMFPIDIRQINWDHGLEAFFFGIRRFYIKEDIVCPFTTTYRQVFHKNHIMPFHDIRKSFSLTRNLVSKKVSSYFASVLLPHRYQEYV
jgi:hypothetical protein